MNAIGTQLRDLRNTIIETDPMAVDGIDGRLSRRKREEGEEPLRNHH